MKRLWLVMLLIAALLLQGCQKEDGPAKEEFKTIILYSELDPKLSSAIAETYTKSSKGRVKLQVITELQENSKPDVVLAERRTLNGLLMDQRLKPIKCKAEEKLPELLQHKEHYWLGAFYDPVVFLINQEFSRRLGQENIRSWEDLLKHSQIRVVMENLSNTNGTKNFLGGFVDARGETEGLAYLWNMNPQVVKYANFPFSPVRMVSMGQADVALTRRSYVFKYLESSFPAYMVTPVEGSPINLYCAGQFKESSQDIECAAFIDWLISSREMQHLSLNCETGYCFILSEGEQERAPELKKLWLNNTYLTAARQEALTKRWLEVVRFSSK